LFTPIAILLLQFLSAGLLQELLNITDIILYGSEMPFIRPTSQT